MPFKDINLYKDYTKVKPLTSSEEDIKESSQNAFPPVDSSEDEEVFRKDSQVILPRMHSNTSQNAFPPVDSSEDEEVFLKDSQVILPRMHSNTSQNAFPPVDSSEDEEVFQKHSQVTEGLMHLRNLIVNGSYSSSP